MTNQPEDALFPGEQIGELSESILNKEPAQPGSKDGLCCQWLPMDYERNRLPMHNTCSRRKKVFYTLQLCGGVKQDYTDVLNPNESKYVYNANHFCYEWINSETDV